MGGGRGLGAVPSGTPGVIGESAGATGSVGIIVIVWGPNKENGGLRLKYERTAAGGGVRGENEGTEVAA
jgi:hypothetical protein